MNARESLCFVVNSPVRLRVLRYVSDSATLNELVDGLPHSRPAVRSATEWYVEHGWFRKQEGVYSRTAIGASVLRHFDGTHEAGGRSISREDMGFICDSVVRSDLLCCSSLPVTASALIEYCDADSTTANRMMESLADRGWYERRGQTYQRTVAGDEAYADFTRLLAVFEQLADKKPLFDRLPNGLADLSVTSLAGASLFAPADGPDEGLAALRRIGSSASDGGFDHIRTICPVFRPSMASTMRDYISFDTRTEVVYDQPTFRKLCAPEQWPMLAAAVAHPYTEVRVYPDDLSFGVGTYDEQGMIVAYNGQPGNAAGITSADEQAIEWINETFEDYWQRSQPASGELTEMLGKYASNSIWGVSDTTFWAAKDEDETASAMLYDLITP